MKIKNAHILRFVLCAFLCVFGLQKTFAQSGIAVVWQPSVDEVSFEERLTFFNAHHIDFLVLKGEVDSNQQSLLAQYNIPFVVDLDYQFLSQSAVKSELEAIQKKAQIWTNKPDSNSTFSGIIAIKHSVVSLENLSISAPFFIQKKDSLIDNRNSLKGIYFTPNKKNVESLYAFVNKIEANSSSLIVNLDWLVSVLETHEPLKDSFLSGNRIEVSTIPLPFKESPSPSVHWSIFVLVLLWISLAAHIKLNPTYYETIPRYFTAHRFFVEDILSYRERSSLSGIFLLFQHALFGGLVTYVLAKTFISPTGLQALYEHLPYLQIFGANYFSIFFLSSFLVLVLEMVALVWLFFPNAQLTHFNQVLNLFTWIFHLDFVIVTLLLTLFFADASPNWTIALSILYVGFWFASFYITAWNASKKLGMKRTNYLLKTIVLHTLVNAISFIAFVLFTAWWDLLELITSV